MITVAAIFDSRADVERAAERLRSVGIADEHLALLSPGTPEREVEEKVLTIETKEPHAGEKVGGAVGRGLWIAGGIMIGGAVGSFLVPGVGGSWPRARSARLRTRAGASSRLDCCAS